MFYYYIYIYKQIILLSLCLETLTEIEIEDGSTAENIYELT